MGHPYTGKQEATGVLHNEVLSMVIATCERRGWRAVPTNGLPHPIIAMRSGETLIGHTTNGVLKHTYPEDYPGWDQHISIDADMNIPGVTGHTNRPQQAATHKALEQTANDLEADGWHVIRAYTMKQNGYLSCPFPDGIAFSQDHIIALESLCTGSIAAKLRRYDTYDGVIVAKFDPRVQRHDQPPKYRTRHHPNDLTDWP